MKSNLLSLIFLVATCFVSSEAAAQNCGSTSINDCGREITQMESAGLWADYCTETCSVRQKRSAQGRSCQRGGCGSGCKSAGAANVDSSCGCETSDSSCGCESSDSCGGSGSGGCRLGNRGGGHFKGRHGGRTGGLLSGGSGCGGSGCGGSGCGCNLGCFGWPAACGSCCGGAVINVTQHCGGGCGGFGGCKLKSLFSRFGGHRDGCGCGLFSGHRAGGGLFSKSAACCGVKGSYFTEAVGYEYGTAGMQSCVAGCSDAALNAVAPAIAPSELNSHDTAPAVEAPKY